MSSIIMEEAGSMEYQIPLVVCPTLALRFSYSKVVPNSAFRSVDLPELWDPIMEIVWYDFFKAFICCLVRPSSSSMLHNFNFT